jgi:hypothetical protein
MRHVLFLARCRVFIQRKEYPMGSLTSRPKVPASVSSPSYTVAAPSPVAAVPTPAPVTQAPSSSSAGDEGSARVENLLTRGRGIFGTVLTGFRGMLAQVESKQRKSLLGE